MNFSDQRRYFIRTIQNSFGWQTNRKIVVIESDDWGCIRMPSRATYESLVGHGFNIGRNRYDKYDSLESNEDLEVLFETLSEFRDSNGHHPIMTFNCIIGNPDFEKIESAGFTDYFFELFTKTYETYPDSDRVMTLLEKGINEGIVIPQYHARDHLNVESWLSDLRKKDKTAHAAFRNKMVSFDAHIGKNPHLQYSDALSYRTPEEKTYVENSIIEGLHLFKNVWGFDPKSFIAPCYIWDSGIERLLSAEGIAFLQGLFFQFVPSLKSTKLRRKYHFSGQWNKFGQRYIVRNAMFEPSDQKYTDPVDNCLKEISIAFRSKKPAVICSHRVNYIGSIDPDNRIRNNRLLGKLLKIILSRWPEVEFMSTDKLGMLMNSP